MSTLEVLGSYVRFREQVNFNMVKGGARMPQAFIVLGLAGEAGEVMEALWAYQNPRTAKLGTSSTGRAELQKELGDLLWYLQALCIDANTELCHLPGAEFSNWPNNLLLEVAKVAELVKKAVWHGEPYDTGAYRQALGGVLQWVRFCCAHYNMSIIDIMEKNCAKLAARYPAGFVEGGGVRA